MLIDMMNPQLKQAFSSQCGQDLSVAAHNFLEQIHLKPLLPASPQLAVHSNLIISNHVNPLDLFILSAIVPPNTYIITLKMNDLGAAFDKYVLPVYISQSRHRGKRLSLVNQYWHYKEGWVKQSQAQKHNRGIIKQAANLLDQGNNVVMFPQGVGFDYHRPWRAGIGYLVQEVTSKKVVVQGVHISNLKGWDMLRPMLPQFLREVLPHKTPVLKYSKPEKLSSYTTRKSANEIKHALFENYQNSFNL